MRQVAVSGDEFFILSVRIALDARGIRHFDGQQSAMTDGISFGRPNCVFVDDADFERATAIVGGLQETPPT
jgi:hypothetical protein